MADIDVVQKKGGASWIMWVLLAVVVVGVVWLLMRGADQTSQESYLDPSDRPSIAIIAAAAA